MSISYRFACRRRTAASWVTNNDVLLSGEIGYETDTDKFKIGDGVTAWNSISTYFTKSTAGITALTGDVTASGTGSVAATLATAQPNAHTWAATQTLTVAPVFTDASGTRTALGLGSAATSATSAFDAAGAATTAQANAQAYADTLVIGLVDDRGNYNASVNTFPASGGSGTAGAVLKGDLWTVSVAGTLGGHAVTAGDLVRALSDTPGQTDANWAITENNIGYVAENSSNKVTSISGASTDTQYPSAKLLYDQLAAAASSAASTYQPLDSDLTAIAALSPSNDDILQRKAGAWTNRTMAQLAADLGAPSLSAANNWTAGQTITPAANTTALTVASHTQTASNPAVTVNQTWNNAGVTFIGKTNAFTSTASAATSKFEVWSIAGAEYFALRKDGLLIVENGIALRNYETTGFFNGGGVWQYLIGSTINFYFNSGEMRARQNYSLNYMASGGSLGGSVNASFAHCGDNAFIFADSASPAAGAAKSRQEKNKQVTGIKDATATTVFTVTIPNAAHSAMIKVTLAGSIGAGGAIGANEATGTISYDIAIARTAGVNAVATISTAYGSITSAVAGATTITVAGDLGAVSGAVDASNTFTIRVTITKGGGSSANHTCMAYARVLNANATGITIS